MLQKDGEDVFLMYVVTIVELNLPGYDFVFDWACIVLLLALDLTLFLVSVIIDQCVECSSEIFL